jgi:hypothetical protein
MNYRRGLLHVYSATIAAGLMAMTGCTQPEKQASPSLPVGRYQLLYGEHESISGSGTKETSKVILRIDTVTGETSEYTSGQGPSGGLQDFWYHIPENPRTGASPR